MTNNPFDTAQEPPATAPVDTPTTGGEVVVTLKGGSGYDAPWIVLHAPSVTDTLKILEDENVKTLVEKTAAVGAFFAATQPVKSGSGRPAGATQPPAGVTVPPGYEYKTGVSKTGKPWKGLFPIDRNSGLQVQWL